MEGPAAGDAALEATLERVVRENLGRGAGPVPEHAGQKVLGGDVALRRSQLQPLVGLFEVLGNTVAAQVEDTQIALAAEIALLRGAPDPAVGEFVVLRHADTLMIHDAEVALRPRVALSRQRSPNP